MLSEKDSSARECITASGAPVGTSLKVFFHGSASARVPIVTRSVSPTPKPALSSSSGAIVRHDVPRTAGSRFPNPAPGIPAP